MEFSETPEFKKDLKRFLKKFRTIQDDLETLKKYLSMEGLTHPNPPATLRITGVGFENPVIIKVKKFACKSLKGRGADSGFRIIYAYYPEERKIEFVEMYFKAEQENYKRKIIL